MLIECKKKYEMASFSIKCLLEPIKKKCIIEKELIRHLRITAITVI